VARPEAPLIGFAAFSGTGKTTLLKGLLRIFTAQGLRVGVVKHAHHTFEIDYPGKDSYELRKAGADQVLIGSRHRWALIVESREPSEHALAAHVARLDRSMLDLILVEGFKPELIPKIELHRPALGHSLLFPDDAEIVAIAADAPLPVQPPIPLLDLNSPADIARFIVDRFLPATQTTAAGKFDP
jgi:molybdopterin-guanine dinucleotide biosynthesis protein B